MVGVFGPLEFLLICLAGCLNQRERMINEYLRAENRILRKQLGKKRLRLTDDQRRRLAVLGKTLGRKALQEWASIDVGGLCWRSGLASSNARTECKGSAILQ